MKVRRPVALFVAIGTTGLALLAVAIAIAESIEHPGQTRGAMFVAVLPLIAEHLASALIVAGIMGLTYEWLVHRETIAGFEKMFQSHQDAVSSALDEQYERFRRLARSAQAMHADDFFVLLSDIAINRAKIPTIYKPARAGDDNEFVFSTNHDFFKNLIGNPDERQRTANALRGWIELRSHVNLRFLGSDLIGMLQLRELAAELRDIFEKERPRWPELTKAEQCCLLNYAWAVSRCEEPVMYRLLSSFLCGEADDEIKKWILHVPLQMQDDDLRQMISEYLDGMGPSIPPKLLAHVKTAIATLHRHDVDMSEVVDKHADLFRDAKLLDGLRAEMKAAPFGGRKSLLSRFFNSN